MVIPGCQEKPLLAGNRIEIGCAWDILGLSRKIGTELSNRSGISVNFKYLSSPVEKLKRGECDIVLMGKEPGGDEIEGLTDAIIAFDAVCLIIDSNSYLGGEYWMGLNPVSKTEGFRNITTEELKRLFTNSNTPFGQRWFWDRYYSWQPLIDLDTMHSVISTWIQKPRLIYPSFRLIPGKYDTQTNLYRSLGLNEDEIASTWNGQYTGTNFNYEEEVLAVEYRPGMPFDPESADFPFKIGFTSRRTASIALQHVPIQVVSINGMDPVKNTQNIYDGSYPLSRKIHFVTRAFPSQEVIQLTEFLLSAEGQKLIERGGYLPLPGKSN